MKKDASFTLSWGLPPDMKELRLFKSHHLLLLFLVFMTYGSISDLDFEIFALDEYSNYQCSACKMPYNHNGLLVAREGFEFLLSMT